jgi:hypothetical protein
MKLLTCLIVILFVGVLVFPAGAYDWRGLVDKINGTEHVLPAGLLRASAINETFWRNGIHIPQADDSKQWFPIWDLNASGRVMAYPMQVIAQDKYGPYETTVPAVWDPKGSAFERNWVNGVPCDAVVGRYGNNISLAYVDPLGLGRTVFLENISIAKFDFIPWVTH